MSRKKKKQERREKLKQTLIFELYGLILLAVAIIGLIQPGKIGEALRGVFRFFAGSYDFLLPLALLILALYVIIKRDWPSSWNHRWTGVLLLCLTLLLFNHISLVKELTLNGQFAEQSIVSATFELYKHDVAAELPQPLGGGMVGALLYSSLDYLFGFNGTYIVGFFLLLISLLLITGKSYLDLVLGVRNAFKRYFAYVRKKREAYAQALEQRKAEQQKMAKDLQISDYGEAQTTEEPEDVAQTESMTPSSATSYPEPEIHDFTEMAYQQQTEQGGDLADVQAVVPVAESLPPHPTATEQLKAEVIAYEEDSKYQLPPFSILRKQSRKSMSEKKSLANNALKLEQTLQSFGVQAKVTNVHRGPAVTRYEVHPDVGVKVSRIVSLTDDIALALAAKGIRIEAPIPGKSAVGIEVPNEDISLVTLREVLESSRYHESESKLTIALGRDISGEPIVAHLNKMPHLLVAGATGSGKSVCINGIIASILYKAKPNEVKLMMIDPKMVELNVYNGIPHLLTPVVTDVKKASVALKKVVAEMERRYDLFAQKGTRDIERYNEMIRDENAHNAQDPQPLLPYIVVIVDELADLMMVAPGDVEDAICRLAQMARAAGIHLIIATQRPSVDVITGVIKANIPSRIAFGVSSQADSRTILDMGGAEKLLGRGDMLFLSVGAAKPVRVQGAFVADEEIAEIVKHCITQQQARYHDEMLPEMTDDPQGDRNEVEDELYNDAVQLVVQQGSASVSMLQRRFRIGYARAARLIDTMELNGIVGPYEGSKPREVLISKEEQSNIS
jgi:S-DNA-T family DNA segregation ATPase FtsK/SpoIIIE